MDKCELKIGCPTCASKEDRESNSILLKQRIYWDKASEDNEVDEKYICDIKSDLFDKVLTLEGKTLEIGCGVGRLMKSGYYGIDISQKMLDIAKKRKPDCYYFLTNGKKIPFEDNTFDNVYSVLVFQHLPIEIVESYINETKRVLKPNGKFIFQFIDGKEDEPFSKHHEFSKILKLLKSFKIIEVKSGYIHKLWTWIFCKKI